MQNSSHFTAKMLMKAIFIESMEKRTSLRRGNQLFLHSVQGSVSNPRAERGNRETREFDLQEIPDMKHQGVLSLSLAAACMIFLGPNLAHAKSAVSNTASATYSSAHAGQHEAMLMVAARAALSRPLDAKKVKVGQHFEARLSKTVHLKNGPKLDRGTELIGEVVKDKMSTDGKTSTMALKFTKAKLKSGQIIPIKATIIGIYPPSAGYGSYESRGPAPNNWTPSTLQVDQINALRGINLHSKIAANDSGVLVSKKKDNMKLNTGSEFALAIAQQGAAGHGMKRMKEKSGA